MRALPDSIVSRWSSKWCPVVFKVLANKIGQKLASEYRKFAVVHRTWWVEQAHVAPLLRG